MATEITVITNGRVKVVKDGGTPQYFSNENHEAQVAGGGSAVAIINSARSLSPAYEIDPLDVTTPAGPWTAVTLCEWLNASPRFFKSAGGGGGGITSVDTLTPITGTGIDPDPVRIADGSVDGDTLAWNAGTGFWVIDPQLVNQRLTGLKSGIFNEPPLEDSSDDINTGTPYDKAVHQFTDINVGGVSEQHVNGVSDGLAGGAVRGSVLSSTFVTETPGSENVAVAGILSLQDQLTAVSQKFNPVNSRTGAVQFIWSNDDGVGTTPLPRLVELYTLSSSDADSGEGYRRVTPQTSGGKHRFRQEFEFDRTIIAGGSVGGTSYADLQFSDAIGQTMQSYRDRQTVDESTPITVWQDPVDAFDDPWPDGTRLSVEFTGQAMGTVSNSSFYVKGICFYVKNGGTGNWDAVFAHTTGTYNAQETITNMISDPTFAFNVTSGGDPFSLIFDPSSGSYSAEPVRVSVFVKRVVTVSL